MWEGNLHHTPLPLNTLQQSLSILKQSWLTSLLEGGFAVMLFATLDERYFFIKTNIYLFLFIYLFIYLLIYLFSYIFIYLFIYFLTKDILIFSFFDEI